MITPAAASKEQVCYLARAN